MDNEKLKKALEEVAKSAAAIDIVKTMKELENIEEGKITNFEKIKAFTLNEMVQFMNDIENENIVFSKANCDKCVEFNGCNKMNCDHCRFLWLLSEAE